MPTRNRVEGTQKYLLTYAFQERSSLSTTLKTWAVIHYPRGGQRPSALLLIGSPTWGHCGALRRHNVLVYSSGRDRTKCANARGPLRDLLRFRCLVGEEGELSPCLFRLCRRRARGGQDAIILLFELRPLTIRASLSLPLSLRLTEAD